MRLRRCQARCRRRPGHSAWAIAGRCPILPREVITHAGVCACPACGSEGLRRISDDEREVLQYVPSHFKVVVHVRPKLSCRGCEAITQPTMPSLPIERGRPGQGLIAHVLVFKYCDHLPLNRQSGIYAREGGRPRSIDLGRLGRTGRLAGRAGGRAHRRLGSRRSGHPCRRHADPGSGSRTRAHQKRPAMGRCARRRHLGLARSAGGFLSLLA
ncbi:IS66 family transposase zinc-finger binding domain-containing protein [Mesorhizobium sp. M0085]|uniref:IS66 family transposase zinc-finger binding domain-containing protein n=1 Tax=Mesorhizobium sp. M0085 TaxID=2956872 RepID=UPI00333959A1